MSTALFATIEVERPQFALSGEQIALVVAQPSLRPDGGVLGACRHHTRAVFGLERWADQVVAMGWPGLTLSSAWLNEYEAGDFVALHTDRPDCALTGLIAVDASHNPVTLCPGLAALPAADLLATATEQPFPIGDAVMLTIDELVLFDGASIPHYRPPSTGACSVLTLTFVTS